MHVFWYINNKVFIFYSHSNQNHIWPLPSAPLTFTRPQKRRHFFLLPQISKFTGWHHSGNKTAKTHFINAQHWRQRITEGGAQKQGGAVKGATGPISTCCSGRVTRRERKQSDDETDGEMSVNHPRGHLLLFPPVIL